MKVLFVTRGYPSQQDPMKGNYEAVQAKAIAKKGHEVSVIGIRWRSVANIFKNKKLDHRVDGDVDVYTCMRVTPFLPHLTIPRLNLLIHKWAFKKVFKRYVKEKGLPDVIHIHSLHAAPAILAIRELCNTPVIITEHWSKILSKKMPLGTKYEIKCWGKECYHMADTVIAVSSSLARVIKKEYGVDCRVVNNMVEDYFFRLPVSVEKHKGFHFVSVGSLFPIKGYDSLIESFSKMDDDVDVRLDIVGRGPEKDKLLKIINKYNQQKRIHLTGVKTPDEVAKLLENSDCFVLASRSETFGIVYIEAMAKGLPVIATRCGGPEEFINEENGLLVNVGDIEALSDALKYMIYNKNRFNRDKIREFCYDNFSESAISDKIIKIYNEIVNN